VQERKKRQEHEEFLKQYGSKMGSQNLANTGSMAAIASNAKKAEVRTPCASFLVFYFLAMTGVCSSALFLQPKNLQVNPKRL
jgi:hypothetical protein